MNAASGRKFNNARIDTGSSAVRAAYISRLSQYFELHPQNPQLRLIRQAVQILRNGGLIAYPTDSCYALGCHIGDAPALERIRPLPAPDPPHHFPPGRRGLAGIAPHAPV